MKLRELDRAWLADAAIQLNLLGWLDAERVHKLGVEAISRGLARPRVRFVDAVLETDVWGMHFENPLGSCAGFDKYVVLSRHLFGLGFGFVEIGTITPKRQEGNPPKRLFKLTEDRAIINRMGFNNPGLEYATNLLKAEREKAVFPGPVGLNVGANKDTEDKIQDYVLCIKAAASLADYLVVNISSPNTPGLRDLQRRSILSELLDRVLAARDETCGPRRVPLLVKLAPDLDDSELEDVAELVVSKRVDGAVLTNTSTGLRSGLVSRGKNEVGGVSGAPLFELSTQILAKFYALTQGKVPLVGVGGIDSGEKAYKKIKAGASLLQLYTALTYEGPGIVKRVLRDLANLLNKDGFSSIREAVGVENSLYASTTKWPSKVPARPAARASA